MQIVQSVSCYCCGCSDLVTAISYSRPPEGETRFAFSDDSYFREVVRCVRCGHFMSRHEMDDSTLYTQDYVTATYGDDGFQNTFDRIISLPADRSDNVGRCNRILEFAKKNLLTAACEDREPTILDVGSGLCVFLYEMKKRGWRGTAMDPDPRAVFHAQNVVQVDAVCADFFQCDEVGRFDLITFNKVLEHVQDPVAMLAKSKSFLNDGGFIYIELPDGESAVHLGPGREEFFIEHHHVFSLASIAMLALRSGFVVNCIERLQEPSTKYTLRAFLSRDPSCCD